MTKQKWVWFKKQSKYLKNLQHEVMLISMYVKNTTQCNCHWEASWKASPLPISLCLKSSSSLLMRCILTGLLLSSILRWTTPFLVKQEWIFPLLLRGQHFYFMDSLVCVKLSLTNSFFANISMAHSIINFRKSWDHHGL